MSNVKTLPGAPTPNNEPVADTVALLEKALDRARAGEIRSVALVGVLGNGHIVSDWVADERGFTMIGALEYLKARIIATVSKSP